MNTITIGRWQIELHQRAIHIQKLADPKCSRCEGSGAIETGSGEYLLDHHWAPDIEPCHCWDPGAGTRIPLWPRRAAHAERYPF